MPPRKPKPSLTLVAPTDTNALQPPRSLKQHGLNLWNRVQAEYCVEDAAGVEALTQACQALDRAEALSAQIAADGEVIRLRNGAMREHPGLKGELANRAFVVLAKLGLNFEPVRPGPGRPGLYDRWQDE